MRHDLTLKKILTYAGLFLLFGVVIGYGVWISHDLLFGISSTVSGVTDGMSVTDPLLTLSGRAHRANDVTLDGSDVSIDQHGNWTDTIALLPGYNVVTVGTTDKFGRTKTKSYRVYYAFAGPTTNPPLPGSTEAATGTPITATSTPSTASTTPATASSTDAVQ